MLLYPVIAVVATMININENGESNKDRTAVRCLQCGAVPSHNIILCDGCLEYFEELNKMVIRERMDHRETFEYGEMWN